MPRKPEHERKADLIAATITEIAVSGSLDVTTSQIAKRAGVSSGLAFHYFKDKDGLFLAAIRSIIARYGMDVRQEMISKTTSYGRLEAIARASFTKSSSGKEAVSAWLHFYTLSLRNSDAKRLLYIYQRRLRSNLVYDLRSLVGSNAYAVSLRIAGLIDGLYLRYALDDRFDVEMDGYEAVMQAISAECVRYQAQQSDPYRNISGEHNGST